MLSSPPAHRPGPRLIESREDAYGPTPSWRRRVVPGRWPLAPRVLIPVRGAPLPCPASLRPHEMFVRDRVCRRKPGRSAATSTSLSRWSSRRPTASSPAGTVGADGRTSRWLSVRAVGRGVAAPVPRLVASCLRQGGRRLRLELAAYARGSRPRPAHGCQGGDRDGGAVRGLELTENSHDVVDIMASVFDDSPEAPHLQLDEVPPLEGQARSGVAASLARRRAPARPAGRGAGVRSRAGCRR